MDILESLENTIILSNYSLKYLDEQKEIIDNIEKKNNNVSKEINFSEKIINSFSSFFERLKFKISFNKKENPPVNKKENPPVNTNTNTPVNTNTNTPNIDQKTILILDRLRVIKESNYLINNELNNQNKTLEDLTLTIDKNNNKIQDLNYLVK